MSKYLKHILTAFLVVCMTVCLGVLAAACTDKPDNSGDDKGGDKNTFPSSVSVTVMLDETTPANGVSVQLCAVKDNGDLGSCLAPVSANAQGVATVPVSESNGNIYEVHLSNIPTGYNYVNAEGTPYSELNVAEGKVGKGVQFDVTKTASVTITLEAENALKLGVEKTAYTGNSYVFTAPAAGYYLFTCDAPSEGWSLNDVAQSNDSKTIQLDKGDTATVAIDFDSTFYGIDSCALKVENGTAPALGSEDNPLALTLGTAKQFTVNLDESYNKITNSTQLTWTVEKYNAAFTTTTAGSYKITLTVAHFFDSIDVEAKTADGASLDLPDVADDGNLDYYYTYTLLENTGYVITLNPSMMSSDYSNAVAPGTTSLTYYIKVEYVENGGNGGEDDVEPIETWEMTSFPKDATYAVEKTLNIETAGTYKFNVSDFSSSDPEVSVSMLEYLNYVYIVDGDKYTTDFMSPTSVNVALTAGEHTVKFYIADAVDFDFSATVKVTETTEEAAEPDPVLNVGDTVVSLEYSMMMGIEPIDYSFTSEEGGSYILTVTGEDAELAYIFIKADYTDCIAPADDDEEAITSYSFTLEAGESIVFTCDSYAEEDTSYTVHIVKNS